MADTSLHVKDATAAVDYQTMSGAPFFRPRHPVSQKREAGTTIRASLPRRLLQQLRAKLERESLARERSGAVYAQRNFGQTAL